MIAFSEGMPGRPNEDACAVESLAGTGVWLGVVADGQGGRAGGARASRLAVDFIRQAVREAELLSLDRPEFWRDLFRDCDQAVLADAEAGITTLAAFVVLNGTVHGASCGDGAVYLCHSDAQILELTEWQQKNPQIGSGCTSSVYFQSPVARSWRVLAMTDGVWKYVGREKVRHCLQTLRGRELETQLQAAARLPGSGTFPDDFSFVLVEG